MYHPRPRDPRIPRPVKVKEDIVSSTPSMAAPNIMASSNKPSSSSTLTPEMQKIIDPVLDYKTMKAKSPEDPGFTYAFYNAFKNLDPEKINNEIHSNCVEGIKSMAFQNEKVVRKLEADFIAKDNELNLVKNEIGKFENFDNELDLMKIEIEKFGDEKLMLESRLTNEKDESKRAWRAQERYKNEWKTSCDEIRQLKLEVKQLKEENLRMRLEMDAEKKHGENDRSFSRKRKSRNDSHTYSARDKVSTSKRRK